MHLDFEVRELDDFCRNLQQKAFLITQIPRMMPWDWRHSSCCSWGQRSLNRGLQIARESKTRNGRPSDLASERMYSQVLSVETKFCRSLRIKATGSSCQLVFARNRCRNFAPCFLYVSDPALKNASQICAALRPSRAAILSSSFLRSVGILNVNCVSFFIGTRLPKHFHSLPHCKGT